MDRVENKEMRRILCFRENMSGTVNKSFEVDWKFEVWE